MTTSTPRRSRRSVVEPDLVPNRWEWVLAVVLPDCAGAALASVQAVLLSVLVVVLPALVTALTTTTDPDLESTWIGAGRVGLRLWLLGHGVSAAVGGAQLTLVPLGITALAVYVAYASARRTGVATRIGLIAGALSYAGLALVVAALSGASAGQFARAGVGGLILGGIGTGLGLVRRSESPSWRQVAAPVSRRLTSPVRVGVRAGVMATTAAMGVAALLTGVWTVAGRATIGDVVHGLSLDAVGGAVYAVGQLAYLPNLVVWALAWLAGPGFQVGSGTRFAPDEVIGGPMPAVPLLGALPSSGASGLVVLLAPILLVVVGMSAGWLLHRRAQDGLWWHQFAAVGSCALTVAAGVGALVAASSGSAGPGRLAVVGATWWTVGPLVGALVGLGAAVVAVPGSAAFRAQLRGWFTAVPTRIGRRSPVVRESPDR